MLKIRIHGRGGHGSVTLAKMIAQAAFMEGRWARATPMFGVERRGAPVEAYTRIDDRRILDRSQVSQPTHLLIQDSSLLEVTDVSHGLGDDGTVLINSTDASDSAALDLGGEVVGVDASAIAKEHLGKSIMNTTLLGAFTAVTQFVSLETIEAVISDAFDGETARNNVDAAAAGFAEVAEA